MAEKTESSSSNMVRTTTPTSGSTSRKRRVASMPFRSGICMSMRITSGLTSVARSTASFPVAASPTTSISGSEPSTARRPSRTMRMVVCYQDADGALREEVSLRGRPFGAGNGRRASTQRATLRPALDGQRTAELLRPLAHRREAYAGDTVPGYPYAVVCDLHLQHTRSPVDREADEAGSGVRVARYVGDALPGRCGRRPPPRRRAAAAASPERPSRRPFYAPYIRPSSVPVESSTMPWLSACWRMDGMSPRSSRAGGLRP